jgi:hypothetical protein
MTPDELPQVSFPKRIPVGAIVVGALVVAAVLLVAASLRRPEPPAFAPTAADPREVGLELVGPVTYTIDASAPEGWRFFDFSRGSAVERPGPMEWDLAFRRFNIIPNGGRGFAGHGGALDLGEADFDTLASVPAAGYVQSDAARDSTNEALGDWYDYGFSSHLLTPKPRVFALRTADGRYAKLEILSYYCPGALPGCVTFRYVYQGRGGPDLLTGSSAPAPDSLR